MEKAEALRQVGPLDPVLEAGLLGLDWGKLPDLIEHLSLTCDYTDGDLSFCVRSDEEVEVALGGREATLALPDVVDALKRLQKLHAGA